MNITREANEHRIPHIFKGLDSYHMAYRLDMIFTELLEEWGIDIPFWLQYKPFYWLEKLEKYEDRS